MTQISQFLHALSKTAPMPHVENIYDRSTPEGVIRYKNLALYLQIMSEQQPKLLIIGEAPGYQGTSRTGVPFASEHVMMGNMPEATFFIQNKDFTQAIQGKHHHKEPTSTIMWRTISVYPCLPLLWAAFPLHPHKPGNTLSNRAPTPKELQKLAPLLYDFIRLFPDMQIVALGNTAHTTLAKLHINAPKIRHPSHGGATLFKQQLYTLLPP